MPEILTAKEVAVKLRTGLSTVYAYAGSGLIKSICMPPTSASKATKQNRNAIRFRLEDIEEFIHSNLRQSHPNEKVMR